MAFCKSCHLLEGSILDFENSLASQGSPETQSLDTKRTSIGFRSEVSLRSETCNGCLSILQALDFHLPTDFKVKHNKFVMPEDYEIYVDMNSKDVQNAYSSPIRISTSGIEGMFLRPSMKYLPRKCLGRVCDPKKLDLSLLQKWISCCEDTHQDTCSNNGEVVSMKTPISVVNYIDTQDSCLRPFSETPKYVALSYVWGRVPTLMTTKSNFDRLSQPGALLEEADKIPKTIRDAITLVRDLGIRYLWVDALCIVQDDMAIKQDHLDHMPWIYEAAHFTLVNVDGENADSGFPGVGENPVQRSVPPNITLPSMTIPIVTEHRNRMKDLQRMGVESKPIWSTRAWTMQEQMYSRRMLLFQGLASWMCHRTQWIEEVDDASESPEWSKTQEPNVRYRLGNPAQIRMSRYGKLVNEYNTRQLSYAEDVGNAFRGTALLHQPVFGPIHYGHPETLFDYSMCWQPDVGLNTTTQKRQPVDPQKQIPSWSWMGWQGSLNLALWEVFQDHELEIFGDMKRVPYQGFDIHIKPTTTFQRTCRGCGQQYPISNSYNECRKEAKIAPGWTKHESPPHWNGRPSYYYETEAERNKIPYRYPIIHTPDANHSCTEPKFDMALSFKTEHFFASIAVTADCKRDSSGQNSVVDAHIKNKQGQRIGTIKLINEPDGTTFENCEIIVISEGLCPSRNADGSRWGKTWVMGREHPFREDVDNETEAIYMFKNVLWIERKDGVAYRKALGRVRYYDWVGSLSATAAEEREVDVILR